MNKKYQGDLEHIRSMMEKSSRFISLSGLSGVVAGAIALIGAFFAHTIIHKDIFSFERTPYQEGTRLYLFLIAFIVLLLSFLSGIILTLRKSKKKNLPIWTNTTKNLMINLFIPLLVGGILCLVFYINRDVIYMAPSMLIFYGLALVNASHFTYGDIKYLGFCEIILGILALIYPFNGLLFWSLGFGVLHIIYGVVMYKKYQ